MDQVQAFPAWRQSALVHTTTPVLVSSHRACWMETSENSMDGISRCIADGIDMAEVDVRTTSDGVLVLMHDATVDRTTDGHGAVSDLSLAQIRTLHLRQRGGGPGSKLTTRRVPTLLEALAAARGKILVNLDVKAAEVAPMVEVILETDSVKDVLMNITDQADPQSLAWARSLGIAVQALYVDTKASAHRVEALRAIVAGEPTVLQVIFRDPATVEEAHRQVEGRPIRLLVNTMALDIDSGRPMELAGPYLDTLAMRHPEQVWGELIRQGVNMIQTDEPQRLLKWLRQKKGD